MARLAAHDGKELRKSDKLRRRVAREARNIENDLTAFMERKI